MSAYLVHIPWQGFTGVDGRKGQTGPPGRKVCCLFTSFSMWFCVFTCILAPHVYTPPARYPYCRAVEGYQGLKGLWGLLDQRFVFESQLKLILGLFFSSLTHKGTKGKTGSTRTQRR